MTGPGHGRDGGAAASRIAVAGFVAAAIFVLTDVVDAPLDRTLGFSAPVLGVPIKRLLLLPIIAGSVLLLARAGPATRAWLRALWPLPALVGLAAVSAAWSAAPGTTLSWAVALAGTTAFGALLALRFSAAQELRIVAVALLAVIAVSLLAVALPPSLLLGRRSDGTFVGMFLDRNLFARVAALCALACGAFAASPAARRDRVAAALGALVATWLLWQSRSLTPRLALLAGGAVAALLWALPRVSPAARRWIVAGVALIGLAAVAAAAAWPQLVFGALGREATLSGRISIWQTVAAAIGERPLLGYGYAAFWRSAAAAPVAHLATNAHNGYLDLLAELGIAGGLLFAVPAAVYAAAAVRRALDRPGAVALWVPAYLGFFLVMNLAESTLLRHKILWALYVAAVSRAALWGRDGRDGGAEPVAPVAID